MTQIDDLKFPSQEAHEEYMRMRAGEVVAIRPEEYVQLRPHVGDLQSQERGSGARFNADKTPYELIPIRSLLMVLQARDCQTNAVIDLLYRLSRWQSGYDGDWLLLEGLSHHDFELAARVFEYGARKYAPWNWAKGMPWSVPVGCIIRHSLAILEGESMDQESGLPHWGHIVCNLIMLEHYTNFYREGDNRPPASVFHDPESA